MGLTPTCGPESEPDDDSSVCTAVTDRALLSQFLNLHKTILKQPSFPRASTPSAPEIWCNPKPFFAAFTPVLRPHQPAVSLQGAPTTT